MTSRATPSLDRRRLLAAGAAGGLGLVVPRLGASPAARGGRGPQAPLNVVYLMPDQLRRQSLRIHGDEVIRTPRIDALACESLVFDRALATTPVCSASRTQLMTGLYTHATGNKLRPDYTTLYTCLADAGYHVGHIGKWHMTPKELLGDTDYVPAVIRPGLAYSAMYEVEHQYRKGVWFLDDDETPRSAGDWEPDCQADLAIRYLRGRKEETAPFFLTLSLGPPHQPYKPLERHDTFEPGEVELLPNVPRSFAERARARIANYYGLMNSIDEVVGRVLDVLAETGLDGSTVVVFTSDHGDMLFSQGEEYKRRPWEESIGVPFLVRFPAGHARSGFARTSGLFRTADVLPTLLDVLGVPCPPGLHGRSYFRAGELEAAYLQQTSGANAPFDSPWRGVTTKDGWKLATSRGRERWVLYDLNEDPSEEENLAEDRGHRARYRELEGLLRDLATDLGDPYFA